MGVGIWGDGHTLGYEKVKELADHAELALEVVDGTREEVDEAGAELGVGGLELGGCYNRP